MVVSVAHSNFRYLMLETVFLVLLFVQRKTRKVFLLGEAIPEDISCPEDAHTFMSTNPRYFH
jgi:hypothetical protein